MKHTVCDFPRNDFDFVLHFFDFTVDVCHLYGEAASVSGSTLVLGRAETSR
jgi:hypothetical protein